jgi:Protein of unknown function (DUF1569)
MKTSFDKATRDELIARIKRLHEASTAQWGKMNVYQMVKHCRLWEEMIAGKTRYKRGFIGLIFGRMALKGMLKTEKPLTRSTPSLKELIVTETGDMVEEKRKWIALVEAQENFSNPGFVHPFFGKMTKEEIGILVYRHTDHHLRQFNC